MATKKQSMNGEDPEDFYTTAKNRQVKFIGVNPTLIDKLQNAGTMPEVPYREVGVPELNDMQKEFLSADDLQTDEEKEQWAEYVQKRNSLTEKRSANVAKAILFHGVDIDDSDIDIWKQEQEEIWGLEVPNNRIDLKVDYINSEIIGNADDIANIMAGVMQKSGVPKEALEEMRATFRGTLRGDSDTEAGETATEEPVEVE